VSSSSIRIGGGEREQSSSVQVKREAKKSRPSKLYQKTLAGSFQAAIAHEFS
jgi:hypothetical protein